METRGPAVAQDEGTWLSNHPGIWSYKHSNRSATSTPARRSLREVRARLQEIADEIHRTPMLSPPVGFDARATGQIWDCHLDDRLCRFNPLAGQI